MISVVVSVLSVHLELDGTLSSTVGRADRTTKVPLYVMDWEWGGVDVTWVQYNVMTFNQSLMTQGSTRS